MRHEKKTLVLKLFWFIHKKCLIEKTHFRIFSLKKVTWTAVDDSLQIKAYSIQKMQNQWNFFWTTYRNRLRELFIPKKILMGYRAPLGFQNMQRKKIISILIFCITHGNRLNEKKTFFKNLLLLITNGLINWIF